jgi:hypothetical protein
MSRHSVANRSTVVGTSARAIASVFSTATVFNTTTTAVAVSLVRFTNATGVGAGLTEVDHDPAKLALATAFAGHTADGGVGSAFYQAALGAAIGSGIIWTCGDNGIVVPVGTANGIGIICPTGTGQILDYYYVWDE